MELFQKSLILSLIVRVWDGIIACYRRSLLCRVVNAIVDWFKRGIIWRILTAPSGLEERFRDSLFYRLLTWAEGENLDRVESEELGRLRRSTYCKT